MWSFDLGPIKGIPVVDDDDARALAATDPYVQACAVAQAMHSADELVAGMDHGDSMVRSEVIDRLLARAPDDERTIPVLVDHLRHDESPDVRGAIARALWWLAPARRLGEHHARHDLIVAALLAAESDRDSWVRWDVQNSLWEFGLRPPPGDLTPEIRAGDDVECGTPADIAYRWGLQRTARGDLVEAVADFDEALRLKPHKAEYFLGRALANFAGVIADLSEAILLEPTDARSLESRGDAHPRHSQMEQAIADFDEAIRLDPWLHDAFIGRAGARWNVGDLAGAIADLGEAIDLDPENAQLFGFRVEVRLLNGDAEGALADHDVAVRFNPADIRVYQSRATTRETIGDLDGAISDWEKALRLGPSDQDIEHRLESLRRRRRNPLQRWRMARRRRQAGRRDLRIADDGNANIGAVD